MFFLKSDIKKKQQQKTAGMLATEVRAGDAPKPTFSTKIDEKSKKSGNQPLNRQKKKPLYPSLHFLSSFYNIFDNIF